MRKAEIHYKKLLAGILKETNEGEYIFQYEESYSDNTLLDKLFFFELTLFSFITGNNDMHLKNFSMIESPSGWVLSPAYDLLNVAIVNPEDNEELALTLVGKKKNLSLTHFKTLGENLGLTQKQINGVLNRLTENKPKAIQ